MLLDHIKEVHADDDAVKEVLESVDEEVSEALPTGAVPEFVALKGEDRLQRVWDLKTRGYKNTIIARLFGVSSRQVSNYLRSYRESRRAQFEQEPPANLISEALEMLRFYERVALREVELIEHEGAIDPDTGKVVKKRGTLKDKNSFLESAMRARKEQLALLQSTGLIPSDVERVFRILEGEKDMSEGKEDGPVRSKEELRARVLDLLSSVKTIS